MGYINKLVLLAVATIWSTVSCMPGHGHGPGKPKPPPPTSGYEEYRNQHNEENANQEVNFRLLEGDILLTSSQLARFEATANQNDPFAPLNAVVNREEFLWKNNRVPYTIDSEMSSSAMSAIRSAMDTYESQTCISFIEHTNEEDYVRFFSGQGCYSYIGRIGGEQDISIGRGCEYSGIVMHEIFHCLGRWHEQSRPDRDSFITINDDNVRSGFENNFEKVSSSYATTQGVPYDYGSVMHYGAYAFTNNGQPTIVPVRTSGVEFDDLGQRDGMSSYDLQHARALYCSDEVTASSQWSNWGSWSSCSRACNGGTRSRMRTCVGGFTCPGSNFDAEDCNTQSCKQEATWSSWSEWSGCSASCGTGRQERQRQCLNGNTCSGRLKQFQDCNSQDCPEVSEWGSWSSWSSCSQTCQGGRWYRRRRCINGNNCVGSNVETNYCNSDVSCTTITVEVGEWSEWSDCTAECGGGTRFRSRQCSGDSQCVSTQEEEDCNIEDCNPEPELRGVQYAGCYYMPVYSNSLYFLEGETKDLSDSPRSREEPVRKCGSAAQLLGYRFFAVTVGYCISGSNSDADYTIFPAHTDLCQGGIGGQYAGYFLMDLYEIADVRSFSESVVSIVGTEEATESTVATSSAARHASCVYLLLWFISIVAIIHK